MRLIALASGQHPVFAVLSGDPAVPACEVLADLKKFESSRRADVRGLRVQFNRYAAAGRGARLGDSFHQVDAQNGIWEFSKGNLRAIGFEDGGRLFVAVTVLMKKTRKVDPQAVSRAIETKRAYLEAKIEGRLIYGKQDDS